MHTAVRTGSPDESTDRLNPPPVVAPRPALPFPPLVRFRFQLEALDPIRLPDYAGSAWRGLLGHGLRRTACVTRQRTCTGCLLAQNCVYSTLFETPPTAAQAQDGYSALPHPFVLDIDPTAPRTLAPGAPFDLTIHLIGAAITQAPYLIHALAIAGQQGLGSARGRFSVTAVAREQTPGDGVWDQVYGARDGVYQTRDPAPLRPPPAPAAVRLRLVTPLRIKRDGHFLGARDLTATDLVHALYRRLRTLAQLQGGDPQWFDLRRVPHEPDALTLGTHRLRWHDWTRYSSRQDTLMQLGGLIGDIALEGPAIPSLWPALWLGQWTHVGKGTAFGLGGTGSTSWTKALQRPGMNRWIASLRKQTDTDQERRIPTHGYTHDS